MQVYSLEPMWKHGFEGAPQQYEHEQDGVTENEVEFCLNKAWQPVIGIIDKVKNGWTKRKKEWSRNVKCLMMSLRMKVMRKADIIPVVVGALWALGMF